MEHLKKMVFLLGIFFSLNALGQTQQNVFHQVYNFIEQKNYFKARELFLSHKNELTEDQSEYTEAILDNAFNKSKESDNKIHHLMLRNIPDSLKYKLYTALKDNAFKSYLYNEARKAAAVILNDYKKYLTEKEIKDCENDLKLYTALENVPPQKVVIRSNSTIQIIKDKIGMNTLKMFFNQDSIHFIFDTGANLSTTSQSIARKLHMKIIPSNIDVGTATNQKVKAQLAVCKKFTFGNIDVYNAVFLVLPDQFLSFPKDHYQIYGILGFPVIEALKEITLTQNGQFIVHKKESRFTGRSNFAMNELMPIIYLDGKNYRFDTGADHTVLYYKYYIENRKKIDQNYKPQKVGFAGAGGSEKFDGYIINPSFRVSGKMIQLKNVPVLKEKIDDTEEYYGNIGQDFIRKFNSMTLNFDKMFIIFK